MSLAKLKDELSQFEDDLQKTYDQFQTLVNRYQRPNHVYCYFDSSLILDNEQQNTHLIIGNFYVNNMSNDPKNLPIILLKLECDGQFDFSGKYKTTNQQNENPHFSWERIELDNFDSSTHYCFQPIELKEIVPKDQLSFQQFQIRFLKDATLSVDGFVYFNGSNDGVKAINRIDIHQ